MSEKEDAFTPADYMEAILHLMLQGGEDSMPRRKETVQAMLAGMEGEGGGDTATKSLDLSEKARAPARQITQPRQISRRRSPAPTPPDPGGANEATAADGGVRSAAAHTHLGERDPGRPTQRQPRAFKPDFTFEGDPDPPPPQPIPEKTGPPIPVPDSGLGDRETTTPPEKKSMKRRRLRYNEGTHGWEEEKAEDPRAKAGEDYRAAVETVVGRHNAGDEPTKGDMDRAAEARAASRSRRQQRPVMAKAWHHRDGDAGLVTKDDEEPKPADDAKPATPPAADANPEPPPKTPPVEQAKPSKSDYTPMALHFDKERHEWVQESRPEVGPADPKPKMATSEGDVERRPSRPDESAKGELAKITEAADLDDETDRLMLADAYEEAGRDVEAAALRGDDHVVMLGGALMNMSREEDLARVVDAVERGAVEGTLGRAHRDEVGSWDAELDDGIFHNTAYVWEEELDVGGRVFAVYFWANTENPNTDAAYQTDRGPYTLNREEAEAGAESFLEER